MFQNEIWEQPHGNFGFWLCEMMIAINHVLHAYAMELGYGVISSKIRSV